MIYEDQIRLQVMWLGHRVEVARRVVADAKAKASEHERIGYEAARYLFLVHDELCGLVEGCSQEDLYTALELAEARMPRGVSHGRDAGTWKGVERRAQPLPSKRGQDKHPLR